MILTHGSKSASMMVASLHYQLQRSLVPSNSVNLADVVHYEDALVAFNEDTGYLNFPMLFKATKQPEHICVPRRAQAGE